MAQSNRIDRNLVPAVSDVSVTNVCNATCSFCSFAHDKDLVTDRRWLDRDGWRRALPILHRRGIRYVNFQGGEPLLHPQIEGLIADARSIGMKPGLITNGWLLPQKMQVIAEAGLGRLLISIDSHAMTEHERNRGLKGVGERIREGIRQAHRAQIPVIASVTVNRLVDYDALPVMLGDLGFDAVAFSYPRRLPFGSSSLVYSEESELLNFESGELVSALDAIKKMKRHFPVLNPTASITDIQNHIQGKDEAFSCVGGYKYFYIDWNLDIWRCEAWSTKLGSVFDFEQMAEDRSHCTNCSMSCYRDTSVMMHAAISMADALSAIASGRIGGAAKLLFRRSVALSALSMIAEAKTLVRLRDKVESPN